MIEYNAQIMVPKTFISPSGQGAGDLGRDLIPLSRQAQLEATSATERWDPWGLKPGRHPPPPLPTP